MSAETIVKQQIDVCLGKAGTLIGHLTYLKQDQREHSALAYDRKWLADTVKFKVSPDRVCYEFTQLIGSIHVLCLDPNRSLGGLI